MNKPNRKSNVTATRSRNNRLRKLQMENLEGRRLMAGMVHHNFLIPEDVNGDFRVTPADALLVINRLNTRRLSAGGEAESGSLGGVTGKDKWDVSGDNRLSPLDALLVINRLNGEGEANKLMRYTYSINAFDPANPTNPTSGSPVTQVAVGSDFWVNVFLQDLRPDNPLTEFNETPGVFSAAIDLGISELNLASFVQGAAPSPFFNGVRFSPDYRSFRDAREGGGIQLGNGDLPVVADGDLFTLTSNGTTVTFEIDTNSVVAAGNVPVTLTTSSPSYAQLAPVLVSAINGSSLGVTARFNGLTVVNLPSSVTFSAFANPGNPAQRTSSFNRSLVSEEYFDEVTAGFRFQDDDGNLISRADGQVYRFFSVQFRANNAGRLTFSPNKADNVLSENSLYVLPRLSIVSSAVNVGTDTITVQAHGFTTGAEVEYQNGGGANIAGLVNGTKYFVRVTNENAFQLYNTAANAEAGGSTGLIDLTSVGNNQQFLIPTDTQPIIIPSSAADSLIDFGLPVSIDIVADPTGPRAVADTITVTEDVARTITASELLANDSSGATPPRTLSVSNIRAIPGVTKGTIVGNVYTPLLDSNEVDFLVYTVTDTSNLTATATITINITPVNDRPDAGDDTFSAVVGSLDNDLDVLANDTPGPANEASQTLTITNVTTPSNGGSVRIAANGRSVIYTPSPTFVGTETFSYTVTDNGSPAQTDTATVTINVQPATLPFARRDVETATEGSRDIVINVLANDLVNQGQQPVLVEITRQPDNGVARIDGSRILYTPSEHFFGTDVLRYRMNETNGTGPGSEGAVTITVTNVNDRPILQNDPATGVVIATEENAPLTIPFATLLANDSPGPNETDTLTITTVTPVTANAGTVSISGTNVIYSPAPNFFGNFLFTYNAIDNGTPPLTAATPATVTITVNPFNDPPVLTPKSFTGTEDTAVTMAITAVLANDSPGPGEASTQTLNLTSVTPVTQGAGSVAIVGANVVYTPANNFNGVFVYNYTATDTGVPAKSSVGTVTITLAAVNDPPVPGADTVRAFKNNEQRIPVVQLLSNDAPGPNAPAGTADNESTQTLSITAVSGATNGSVRLDAASGFVIFTPAADFTGAASFQYTVQDNGGGTTNSATGSVTVNVEEFLPSTIGGRVWVDETNDGRITNRELFLGGVMVSLSGTSLGQTVNQTAITLADGSFEFDDLGPGSYQVTFAPPQFSIPSQHFSNGPYSFNIAEPGGFDVEQNFAVHGMDPFMVTKLSRLMDQLITRFQSSNPTIASRGAYFALGADNSMLWGMQIAGFGSSKFTEAVIDGDNLLVTVVNEADHSLRTYNVPKQYFQVFPDAAGNRLVRLLGGTSDLPNMVSTSLTNRAFSAPNYLESVEKVFEFYDL